MCFAPKSMAGLHNIHPTQEFSQLQKILQNLDLE